MSGQIPPQLQNQIMQLQQIQVQLQALQEQKTQIEAILRDSDDALEELNKAKDDEIVYKSVGEILVKSTKDDAIKELTEKKEMMNIRKQTLDRQEERLKNRLNQLQEQLQNILGGMKGEA
ncbi:MAG: prefoldin subunit beta [Candidatus Methanoliparum thermophilum]|uniref:Prefoldin subunit beta n=1 Tax=Methanoliparum thermophilum TaxID=2491083 RepID=A0A520KQI2_METT2|nr:MAG: prefoldin subunit beta [Candidatus Methanoliparum thermophilum]